MSTAANTPWSQLREQLDKQKEQYKKLLELFARKEKVIIDGKEKDLGKLVKEEEALINQLEKFEVERGKIAAECLPDTQAAPTLRELLDKAPEEEKEALEQAAILLLEVMNEASAANHGIAELVQEAMNFANYQLNLFNSESQQENLYRDNGKIQDSKPRLKGIFNRQA